MVEKTLAIIKPDSVEDKNVGKIIDRIEQEGFNILEMKKTQLITKQAENFYAVHKGKPFLSELVEYVTSGPVIVMVLEKENAIADWRKLMGATDPAKAEENTLRKLYGTHIGRNATHGSDSPENAEIEIKFFFPNI
ncbi:nucleoside-diphosphate kinase [Candidatus Dependentiae bacterium]